MKSWKKIACIAAACAIGTIGAAFVVASMYSTMPISEEDVDVAVSYTQEDKESALRRIAEKLETINQSNSTERTVELRILEDGKCQLVEIFSEGDDSEEGTVEVILGEAISIDEMFENYCAAGFISESGEVLGFPDESHSATSESESQDPSVDEILEAVEIEGADNTIAGFPENTDNLPED